MKKKIASKRKIGRKKTNPYFHAGTHDAIVRYQQSTDMKEKEQIYVTDIFPAFDKLAENLIFIHGFATMYGSYEDLKNDCVSFLFETLRKFDPTRGSKAFSYFNVVAKNWLIIKVNQKTKRTRKHVSIHDNASLSELDFLEIESYIIENAQDTKMIKQETKQNMLQLMQSIKSRLTNDHEILCIDAILSLFDRLEDLELLNKRAIFIYIRDISNLTPKQLSIAMSSIRRHYKDLMKTGEFDIFF